MKKNPVAKATTKSKFGSRVKTQANGVADTPVLRAIFSKKNSKRAFGGR